MSISLSDLAGCYVVLWSPRHKIYQTEKFSVMLDRNHTFFFRQARTLPDWVLIGVAHSAEAADNIRMRADLELSERRHPTPQSREELEAEEAESEATLEALESGAPLPESTRREKPRKPAWWISEK